MNACADHAWLPHQWRDKSSTTTVGMRCSACASRVLHYQVLADGTFRRFENPSQAQVLDDDTSPLILFASGYRGGKTWTIIQFVLDGVMLGPPGTQGAITEPTYKMVTRILERGPSSVERWVRMRGLPWSYNRTDHYVSLPDGRGIWLLSTEDPDSLPGFTALKIGVDEAALVDERAYEQLNMRLSDPSGTPQMICGSTHEGTNTWFARLMGERKPDGSPRHRSVRGTTHDNFTLPKSYLKRQETIWEPGTPEHDMYVLGIPRMLTGSIFTALKPAVHFRHCGNPGAGQIVLGGDFNDKFMVTTIGRLLRGELHVWGEVITCGGGRADQTPGWGDDAATRFHYGRVRQFLLDKKLCFYRDGAVRQVSDREQVLVYCDASGGSARTSATRTDHELVREMGFWTVHDPSNPPIRDSINNVQAAAAERRLFFDPVGAPETCRAMLEHARDKRTGKPRKDYDQLKDVPFDAFTDCIRYKAWHLLPVHRR